VAAPSNGQTLAVTLSEAVTGGVKVATPASGVVAVSIEAISTPLR
jgi:hypothetical protein